MDLLASPWPPLRARGAYELYVKAPDHRPGTHTAYMQALRNWETLPLSVPLDPSNPAVRIVLRNPPLDCCDNQTLREFRDQLLGEVAPATVNIRLTHMGAIFNKLAPRNKHNPDGLGILRNEIPYCKKCKVRRRKPRIAKQDELSRLYLACAGAVWPVQRKTRIDPCDWWRALIVLAYNAGLRRIDLMGALWDDVDLEQGTIAWDAEKTGKLMVLPLHPVVVEHLRRIVQPERKVVFAWKWGQTGPTPADDFKRSFYRAWHRIVQRAELKQRLTPHDLRRTSGDGLFRDSPAAAAELLQHASINTTMQSYSDATPQLRELVLGRTQPAEFYPPPEDDDPPAIIRFPAG